MYHVSCQSGVSMWYVVKKDMQCRDVCQKCVFYLSVAWFIHCLYTRNLSTVFPWQWTVEMLPSTLKLRIFQGFYMTVLPFLGKPALAWQPNINSPGSPDVSICFSLISLCFLFIHVYVCFILFFWTLRTHLSSWDRDPPNIFYICLSRLTLDMQVKSFQSATVWF